MAFLNFTNDSPSNNFEIATHYQSNCLCIKRVFLLQNPCCESALSIVIQHRHDSLRDNRTTVKRIVDKVDGAAADLCSMRDRLPLSVKTRERREQARVYVEHPRLESGA